MRLIRYAAQKTVPGTCETALVSLRSLSMDAANETPVIGSRIGVLVVACRNLHKDQRVKTGSKIMALS